MYFKNLRYLHRAFLKSSNISSPYAQTELIGLSTTNQPIQNNYLPRCQCIYWYYK